jgi:predicted metal-binding protein
MEGYEEYVAMALRLGAADAKIIRADSVVTAAWVRMKCRYGCGYYGSNLCCPPNSPTFAETNELLSGFAHALLVHIKNSVHTEPHPTRIVTVLEREMFLAGHYKAFALGSGPCRICEDCNRVHCINPKDARPSMESCGIDVFQTARNNGFVIEVLTDRHCVADRFGLVLIE